MSSLSLGVCTPWLSQWTSTSGKLLSQSLQPFFLESNTALYVSCFLSPKQFLNSQNYHTRFPGHVKSGRLAQLPEEGNNYLACEPLFVFMILSSSVECRASLECLLCTRYSIRHQGWKGHGPLSVRFIVWKDDRHQTETLDPSASVPQEGVILGKGVVSCQGLQNSEMEGQARGRKKILKRENSMYKGCIYLLFSSVAQSCPPCPSPTPGVHSNSTSIKLVMPSSHLILCHPLLLPPISPSIRVFSNESTLHMRWPKYWSFSFSIIPSKEHPRLISFRMDWLDLFAVQGTLESSHTTVQKHQFFSAQPSPSNIHTWPQEKP